MEVHNDIVKRLEIPVDFLKTFQIRKRRPGEPRSERDELLDVFVARLNAGNIADGYPKTTHARVAKMLAHIPTGDLYDVYRKCDTYRKFGAGLRTELKPRL